MTGRRAAALLLLAACLSGRPSGALAGAAADAAAAANQAGAALYRAGRVAEAVSKFEEALALDPTAEGIRRNVAAALATLGQSELRSGRFDDARTHLERAVELAPREAPYHVLLGALFFRRGQLYEARRRIERALELAPGLSEALELSGDVFYQEGALEQARSAWEAALAAAGPREPALRAKLERIGREAGAERGFGRDVSRHFTVQFDGPVPPEVARTALRLLEEAYDRLWREFGRPPQHDVPVILYSRELFERITLSPGWVAGAYDGKIRVPVGGLRSAADAERLRPILAHELTHAFIRANVPVRPPLWFEEGLAQHFEGTGFEAARRAALGAGRAFTSLEQVSAELRGGARVAAAYGAAALAVEEMVRMNGFWLPRRTLEHLAAGRPFPEAFREAAGIDLEEFEKRWARLLQ